MLTFLLNPRKRRRGGAKKSRRRGSTSWSGAAKRFICSRAGAAAGPSLRSRVCLSAAQRRRAGGIKGRATRMRRKSEKASLYQRAMSSLWGGKNPRRRSRRRNRTWVPAFRHGAFNTGDYQPTYSYNPGIVGNLTAGFKPSNMVTGLSIVGGALANAFVTGQALGLVGRFAPGAASSKVAQVGVGVASAGAVGALGRMISPRYASNLFTGALAQVVASVIREPLESLLGRAQAAPAMVAAGTQGLDDYLTQSQVSSARRLDGLDGLDGDLSDQVLGDSNF